MTEIQGRVIDESTGEPLAGVQVKSYNNPYYTAMTDEQGAFWINVPDFVTSLQASLEGYNMAVIAINGRTNRVDIKLYTNCPTVNLKINGKEVPLERGELGIVIAHGVTLQSGDNLITATAQRDGTLVTDQCNWISP